MACRDRLSGAGLWQYLRAGGARLASPASDQDGRGGSSRLAARAACVDRRGRPIVAGLTSLRRRPASACWCSWPTWPRRRPLLTRDVLAPELGREGLYLHGACVAARAGLAVPAASDARVRAGGRDDGLRERGAEPALVATFAHVFFVDPPFSTHAAGRGRGRRRRRSLGTSTAGGQVKYTSPRRCWLPATTWTRDCGRCGGWSRGRHGRPVDGAAESELLGAGPFLAELPTLAAALGDARARPVCWPPRTARTRSDRRKQGRPVDIEDVSDDGTDCFSTKTYPAALPDGAALTHVPERVPAAARRPVRGRRALQPGPRPGAHHARLRGRLHPARRAEPQERRGLHPPPGRHGAQLRRAQARLGDHRRGPAARRRRGHGHAARRGSRSSSAARSPCWSTASPS